MLIVSHGRSRLHFKRRQHTDMSGPPTLRSDSGSSCIFYEHLDPTCVKDASVQRSKPEYSASPTAPPAAKPSLPLRDDSGMQPHNRHPLFISITVDSLRKVLHIYHFGMRSAKMFQCSLHITQHRDCEHSLNKGILTYRPFVY